MNSNIRTLLAAMAMVWATAVQAAAVTVNMGDTYKGVALTGAGTLSISTLALSVFDTWQNPITPVGEAALTVDRALDPLDNKYYYNSASLAMPVSSLTIDDAADSLLAISLDGGIKIVQPIFRGITTGGNVALTDLRVDLTEKRLYATLTGANGVGTLSNFHLWDINTVAGATVLTNGELTNVVSGLAFTADGLSIFSTALGHFPLSQGAWQSVQSFGTITTTIGPLPVPEPSSYALFSVGLAGVALAMRRRRQNSN